MGVVINMNQLMLRFSNTVVVIGICTLILTKVINLILPKLGYMAFQAAAVGSYSSTNYLVDFKSVDITAIILIIVGLGIGHIVYRKEQGESLFKMPNEWFK